MEKQWQIMTSTTLRLADWLALVWPQMAMLRGKTLINHQILGTPFSEIHISHGVKRKDFNFDPMIHGA